MEIDREALRDSVRAHDRQVEKLIKRLEAFNDDLDEIAAWKGDVTSFLTDLLDTLGAALVDEDVELHRLRMGLLGLIDCTPEGPMEFDFSGFDATKFSDLTIDLGTLARDIETELDR